MERAVADLPSGTVPFLFTDIEGSTALWERDQVAMAVPRRVEGDAGTAVTPQNPVDRSCRRIPDGTDAPVSHRIACAIRTLGYGSA